jgi:ABC-type Fe2+-enterobactin transport system substrate-binding protein
MLQEDYRTAYDKRAERGNPNSAVARLMQQIDLEYAAAERAVNGMAEGAARHDFINQRMENVGICHQRLRKIVGEDQAAVLILQAEQAREASGQ